MWQVLFNRQGNSHQVKLLDVLWSITVAVKGVIVAIVGDEYALQMCAHIYHWFVCLEMYADVMKLAYKLITSGKSTAVEVMCTQKHNQTSELTARMKR